MPSSAARAWISERSRVDSLILTRLFLRRVAQAYSPYRRNTASEVTSISTCRLRKPTEFFLVAIKRFHGFPLIRYLSIALRLGTIVFRRTDPSSFIYAPRIVLVISIANRLDDGSTHKSMLTTTASPIRLPTGWLFRTRTCSIYSGAGSSCSNPGDSLRQDRRSMQRSAASRSAQEIS